jgi:hypothetical protein
VITADKEGAGEHSALAVTPVPETLEATPTKVVTLLGKEALSPAVATDGQSPGSPAVAVEQSASASASVRTLFVGSE